LSGLSRLISQLNAQCRRRFRQRLPRSTRCRNTAHVVAEVLEVRQLLSSTLLVQSLFPADNPWNQNISQAPVAANSAAIISHIGAAIHVHPDWGPDNPANGSAPLYGIPFNVVHGN